MDVNYSSLITTFLWFVSVLMIPTAYYFTRNLKANTLAGKFSRYMFCLMVGHSTWLISTYALWLLGVPLKIGILAVEGQMEAHFWLPPVALLLTVGAYYSVKINEKTQGENV